MRNLILILISLVLLVIDKSLMPFLSINGAFPSILFTFAVAYSIINGRKEAVIIGIVSGLLQDIYFYGGFGVNTLINMLICLLAAIIGENIYKDKKLVPIVSVIFLYILKVLFIFLIFKIANKAIDIQTGIYTSIYSGIIMAFGYKFVLRLYVKK